MIRRKIKEFNIFSLSMLDVVLSSMGAFLIIIFIIFPHYNKKAIEYLNEESLIVQQKMQKIKNLEKVVIRKNNEIRVLKEELKKHSKTNKQLQSSIDVLIKNKNNLNLLNDHKIVFMLDVSGSIDSNDQIANLKTGLKKIIATMDEHYFIDIVLFPYKRSTYKEYYGELKQVTEEIKYNLFQYLDNINFQGNSSPISKTLISILNNRNYNKVESVIILSDGEDDDIESQSLMKKKVNEIKSANISNTKIKKINTIGFGDNFVYEKFQKNLAYDFFLKLSMENNGFHIGLWNIINDKGHKFIIKYHNQHVKIDQ